MFMCSSLFVDVHCLFFRHFLFLWFYFFFFFKQKTAYEMRISDWSSDVCSSDPLQVLALALPGTRMADDLVQRLHGAGLILLGLLNIGPIGLPRIPRRSINPRAHVFRGPVARGRIPHRLPAFDAPPPPGLPLFPPPRALPASPLPPPPPPPPPP